MTHEKEILLELYSLTKGPSVSGNDATTIGSEQSDLKCYQPWQDHCLPLFTERLGGSRKGTCLCDAVVVCQEHGEILGFLDGLGVCHLPQKLGSSGREKFSITKDRSPSVRLSPPIFPV